MRILPFLTVRLATSTGKGRSDFPCSAPDANAPGQHRVPQADRLPDKITVPVSATQRCQNRAAYCPARRCGAELVAQQQDVGPQRTVDLSTPRAERVSPGHLVSGGGTTPSYSARSRA